MRDSSNRLTTDAPIQGQPANEKSYFESFYRAIEPATGYRARDTIGMVSEMDSRFHYNATGNSIIRALARLEPPPRPAMLSAWESARLREARRHLDIGSGTGHWVDFMRDVFAAKESVAIEFSDRMATLLAHKYSTDTRVRVVQHDIAEPGLDVSFLGGPFDYITAIGVMFHIIDDRRWREALQNLAHCLNPKGVLLVGGEFGARTYDSEAMHSDRFESWRDYHKQRAAGQSFVTKRVRSLATWEAEASEAGLQVVDVVRTDREPALTTPENDVLVLMPRAR